MKNKIYLILMLSSFILWLISYNFINHTSYWLLGICLAIFWLIIRKSLKIKIKNESSYIYLFLFISFGFFIQVYIRKKPFSSSLVAYGIILCMLLFMYFGPTKFPFLFKQTNLNLFGAIGLISLIIGITFLIANIIYPIPNQLNINIVILSSLLIGILFLFINYLIIKRKIRH